MNKMKYSVLFLAAALILIFSSCSGMMTETDDVSIDLSSVISRTIEDWTAVNTVKVWLVAEGTNNFYDLPDGESSQEISVEDPIIELTHIPAGPVYRIYMSIGDDDGTKFTNRKSVTGLISVTGGTSIDKTLTSEDLKTNLAPQLIGKAVNSSAFVNSQIYTVAADGTELYHGTVSAMNTETAPAGFLFRDVDAGYSNNAIISAQADNGQAIGVYSGTGSITGATFGASSGLPTEWGGSGALDILETFIFNDETAGIQLGISQLDTGIVLSSYDGDWVWQTIPLGEALASLEELPISIDASFFKGLSVMKQGSQATSDEEAWIFISTVIGNYRIAVPMTAGGFDDAGFNDPLKILGDFVTGNEDLEDRVILNIDNNSNQFLYVGTDSGLYKMTATDAVGDMAAEEIFAEGERIEMLNCGTNYTACITPLNLLLIDNDGKVAKVAFNEGLPGDPETGLLNAADGKGITGLDWNGNTLYITGGYGLASIDASAASLWE